MENKKRKPINYLKEKKKSYILYGITNCFVLNSILFFNKKLFLTLYSKKNLYLVSFSTFLLPLFYISLQNIRIENSIIFFDIESKNDF
jgi:hypothetical protein